MPVRYVIDKERRLAISTGAGCVTFDEMKAHQDQLLSDPDFNPEFNQVLDGTAVTVLDISVDETKELVRRTMFSATSRRACVATSPAIYGMMRLAEAYHGMSKEPYQFAVFYDLLSALKWLGLESLPDPTDAEAKKPNTAEGAKNTNIG
ncbi:MAG: hypothetical protein ABSE40_20575 [Candidatus Sulfotelmatobacter sp.]|jgi:hypothetical protein